MLVLEATLSVDGYTNCNEYNSHAELFTLIQGQVVYVYSKSGAILEKKLTCECSPLDAFIFEFRTSNVTVQTTITILLDPHSIRFVNLDTGESRDLISECPIEIILPCEFGLILQSSSTKDEYDNNHPGLFSLSQMMGSLKPISFNEVNTTSHIPMDIDSFHEQSSMEFSNIINNNINFETMDLIAIDSSFVGIINKSKNTLHIFFIHLLSQETKNLDDSSHVLESSSYFDKSETISINPITFPTKRNKITTTTTSSTTPAYKSLLGQSSRRNRASPSPIGWHDTIHTVLGANTPPHMALDHTTSHSQVSTTTPISEPEVSLRHLCELDLPSEGVKGEYSFRFSRSLLGELLVYLLQLSTGTLYIYLLKDTMATSSKQQQRGVPAHPQANSCQLHLLSRIPGAGSSLALVKAPLGVGAGASGPHLCLALVANENEGSMQVLLNGYHLTIASDRWCLEDLSMTNFGEDEETVSVDISHVQSLGGNSACALITTAEGRRLVARLPTLLFGVSEHVAEAVICVLSEGPQIEVAVAAIRLLAQCTSLILNESDHAAVGGNLDAALSLFPSVFLLFSAFGIHRNISFLQKYCDHFTWKLPSGCGPLGDEFFGICINHSGKGFTSGNPQSYQNAGVNDIPSEIFDILHTFQEDWRLKCLDNYESADVYRSIRIAILAVIYSCGNENDCFVDHYHRCGVRLPESLLEALEGALRPKREYSGLSLQMSCAPCIINWLADSLVSILSNTADDTLLMTDFWHSKLVESPLLVRRPAGPLTSTLLTISFLNKLLLSPYSHTDSYQTDCWPKRIVQALRDCELEDPQHMRDSAIPSESQETSKRPGKEFRRGRYLNHLPLALRILCESALYTYRDQMCVTDCWTEEVLQLQFREDILVSMTSSQRHQNLLYSIVSPSNLGATAEGGFSNSPSISSLTDDSDGLKQVYASSLRRFADDERVKEVCRLLRSSRPLYLKVPHIGSGEEEASDAYRHRQQSKLFSLCRRSLALFVGRGLFTMSSLDPLIAEPLPIPKFVLSGRVPPTNAVVALDLSNAPADLTLWPEFHNGVAAGLRVRSSQSGITRNWIIYNKPQQPDNSHAGVLLALGLLGHLKVLTPMDLSEYLTMSHEPTTVAILIGLAASRLGSADIKVSKTLCVHLPTLLPLRHLDLEVSPIIQISALTGLGLLYCQTAHRLMVEYLLAELGRRLTSDLVDFKEALTLSAGWALGMTLLGKGVSASTGLSDLRVEDRLQAFITGGNNSYTSHVFSYDNFSNAVDNNSKSSRVLEGGDIHTDVTAPGAVIALALMYIKSNNITAAKRLSIPCTQYELDLIRPDMLLYRAVGRCIILWDSVEPSIDWLDSNIPEIIREALFNDGSNRNSFSHSSKKPIDRQVALSCYMCIIAGSALGLALVYAGTSDLAVRNTLLAKVKFFQSLRENKSPAFLMDKSMRPLLDLCLSTAAVALCCAMAGSGDVYCLRVIRELRWKVDDVNFGTHMANAMGLGLLYLVGGQASLKRDNISIAALLLALIPRFPSRSTDNQYHLQVWRHFSVLAVEGRAVQPIDALTGAASSIDIEILMKDGSVITRKAPCLLPELSTVAKVRNQSPEFYQSEIDIEQLLRNQSPNGVRISRRNGGVLFLPALPLRRRETDLLHWNSSSHRSLWNTATTQRILASLVDDSKANAHISALMEGSYTNNGASQTPFSYRNICRNVKSSQLLPSSMDLIAMYRLLQIITPLCSLPTLPFGLSATLRDKCFLIEALLESFRNPSDSLKSYDNLLQYARAGKWPEDSEEESDLILLLSRHRLPYYKLWPEHLLKALNCLRGVEDFNFACELLRISFELNGEI